MTKSEATAIYQRATQILNLLHQEQANMSPSSRGYARVGLAITEASRLLDMANAELGMVNVAVAAARSAKVSP